MLYFFFNFGNGRRWLVKATPRPLYPRQSPGTHRWLCGPQGRSGWVEKNSPPTGIRTPDRPACSKSLYRRGYPSPRKKMEFFIFRPMNTCAKIIIKVIFLFDIKFGPYHLAHWTQNYTMIIAILNSYHHNTPKLFKLINTN